MAALSSCNAPSHIRLLATSSIIEPTHKRPGSNTLAIARIPTSPHVPIRFSGAPEIQVVPTRSHRFKSLCMAPDEEGDLEVQYVDSPTAVVRAFYAAINNRDVNALSDLITDGCVFSDSYFPNAFEGRKVVLEFLKDLMEAMGKGMQFVIDSVSEGDSFTVGVIWHLEWEGRMFPSSEGCSFCRCEVQGERLLIRYMQHFIEPPIKPGELTLRLLRTITSTLERFPMLIKTFLEKPHYAFAVVFMVYNKYIKPLLMSILYPFILYYHMMVSSFLYWASFILKIVLKIQKFFSS